MALKLFTSAGDILSPSDTKFDEVPTPEWGEGTGVRVRSLSARESSTYIDSLQEERQIAKTIVRVPRAEDARLKCTVVAMAVIDEAGKRLFTDSQVAELGEKNNAPITRIWQRVLQLSGIGDPEQAKRLGEASSAGPSGASSSDSPGTSVAP